MTPTYYLVLSAALFTIGAVGVLVRRNAIVVFMCVELMLNASNLALVAFAKQNGNLDGQVTAFFVMPMVLRPESAMLWPSVFVGGVVRTCTTLADALARNGTEHTA